jgi:hypothetical protein
VDESGRWNNFLKKNNIIKPFKSLAVLGDLKKGRLYIAHPHLDIDSKTAVNGKRMLEIVDKHYKKSTSKVQEAKNFVKYLEDLKKEGNDKTPLLS